MNSETLLTTVLGTEGRLKMEPVKVWSPTQVFCTKNGRILQLHTSNLGHREWRPLPDFEEAAKLYNCDDIQSQ